MYGLSAEIRKSCSGHCREVAVSRNLTVLAYTPIDMLCWKMTHWWMTKRKLANPGLQLPEMLLQLKVVWPYLSFAFILFSFTNANNVQLNNYLELAESIFDRILSIDRPLFQALGGGSSSSSLLFSVWVLPTITAHSRHEKNCNFWHDHQWHSPAWRICS